ncbi:MAG: THxN family PEP-CTERM protein [Pseudomonadota bacterium]
MNVTKVFAAAASAAVVTLGSAFAAPVSFTDVDAQWVASQGNFSNVRFLNGNPNSVRMDWSTNVNPASDRSAYVFDTNVPAIPGGVVPPNTGPLLLGTFTHENNELPLGSTQWTDVTLNLVVDLVIDGNAFNDIDLSFNFNHNETPNNTPCQAAGATICPDIITVTNNNTLDSVFIVDGIAYTLSVLGLFDNAQGTGSPLMQFITEEEQANTAYLFATLSAAEVPLPAAVWMMIAGLGGLGFASRSKKKAA